MVEGGYAQRALRSSDERHEDVSRAFALEHALGERFEARVVVDDLAIDHRDVLAAVLACERLAVLLVPAHVGGQVRGFGCSPRLGCGLSQRACERLRDESGERHATLRGCGLRVANDLGWQAAQVNRLFDSAARHDHVDNIRGQCEQLAEPLSA